MTIVSHEIWNFRAFFIFPFYILYGPNIHYIYRLRPFIGFMVSGPYITRLWLHNQIHSFTQFSFSPICLQNKYYYASLASYSISIIPFFFSSMLLARQHKQLRIWHINERNYSKNMKICCWNQYWIWVQPVQKKYLLLIMSWRMII